MGIAVYCSDSSHGVANLKIPVFVRATIFWFILLLCFPLESVERGSSCPVVFLSDIPNDVVTAAPLLRRRYSLAANRAWHCQQWSSHNTRKLPEFWSCRKNGAEHWRFGDDQAECSLPTTQDYTATSKSKQAVGLQNGLAMP